MRVCGWLWLALWVPMVAGGAPEQVVVFQEAGRFGGWPANHGLWAWGNEIVVGFTSATYKWTAKGHATDRSQLFWDRQARSRDGGRSWKVEEMAVLTPGQPGGPEATELPGEMNFRSADFALKFRFGDNNKGPSWFYYSMDRCPTWKGPFRFPALGQKGISARTDYHVLGPLECVAFLSAAKSDGHEGRPLAVRTVDGGRNWQFMSWIGPEPEGFSIMPSSVPLSGGGYGVAVRRKEKGRGWIEYYTSEDAGRNWRCLNREVTSTGTGNPPSLIRLKDGRLCLTYGYRAAPYGLRARFSRDEGASWSDEVVLRRDGSSGDLGYPRSVQRPDGKVVTVYYFNGPANRERTIEATVWDPGS